MTRSISSILTEANGRRRRDERVAVLRAHDTAPLRTVIEHALNPAIRWDLPEGPVPYRRNDGDNLDGRLHVEARRLYIFVEDALPGISRARREQLFIQLLESIEPHDAELLVRIKDGDWPYRNLSRSVVAEAFPDMAPALGEEDK